MTRAESVRVAWPLFQAAGGGSTPTSALQLRIETIPFKDARKLNRLWHSRLPAIDNPPNLLDLYPTFGAEFDGLWYAVAIWSNPVARKLPQQTWLELRRLAIAGDSPRNTASRMLAVMARLIRRSHPQVERLVSYQDREAHTGGIYRAAGWTPAILIDDRTRWRPWHRNSRPRNTPQSESPKQRWELLLHPHPPDERDEPAPLGVGRPAG